MMSSLVGVVIASGPGDSDCEPAAAADLPPAAVDLQGGLQSHSVISCLTFQL